MRRRKDDFKNKLAHYYTTEYDAVFLEDLNVKGMLEASGNARNKWEVGWCDLITVFEHHGEKNRLSGRNGSSRRHDQGVCVVRRGDGQAAVGA